MRHLNTAMGIRVLVIFYLSLKPPAYYEIQKVIYSHDVAVNLTCLIIKLPLL